MSPPKCKSLRRSKLVTLAQNRRELELAAKSGADIVQINLEDGVPADRRVEARSILQRALREIDWGGAERWIKINSLSTQETERDIEAITEASPEAIIMAKLQTPEDVQIIAGMVENAERKAGLAVGAVSLVASIERIKALSRVEEIATCHERMIAIQFGPTDMSYELGYRLDRTGQSLETLYARSRCVLAAKLAGIDVGDGPYWLYQDHQGTLRSAMWSFQLGFTHKACHAPEQVPIVHKAYEMMSDPQADWAERYLGEHHH